MKYSFLVYTLFNLIIQKSKVSMLVHLWDGILFLMIILKILWQEKLGFFFVLFFTVNFIILKIAHFSEFPFLDGLECAT